MQLCASVSPYLSRHLARSYGDRAPLVAQLASSSETAGGSGALGRRLVLGHPVIAAEVVYAARHEYCQTVCDFIARRTRLAFIDVEAAEAALPAVGKRGVVYSRWFLRKVAAITLRSKHSWHHLSYAVHFTSYSFIRIG